MRHESCRMALRAIWSCGPVPLRESGPPPSRKLHLFPDFTKARLALSVRRASWTLGTCPWVRRLAAPTSYADGSPPLGLGARLLAQDAFPTVKRRFMASRTRSGSYLTSRPILRYGIARLFFWL